MFMYVSAMLIIVHSILKTRVKRRDFLSGALKMVMDGMSNGDDRKNEEEGDLN